MSMFRFGCGHAKYDPEIHDAQWGAPARSPRSARPQPCDRADLLEALDARPDLSQGDLMALRLILDDAIEEARHRLTLPDYSDEDKEWMRVRLAGAERLMDRLNAL